MLVKDQPDWVTTREAAARLQVSVSTVMNKINAGELRAIKKNERKKTSPYLVDASQLPLRGAEVDGMRSASVTQTETGLNTPDPLDEHIRSVVLRWLDECEAAGFLEASLLPVRSVSRLVSSIRKSTHNLLTGF